VIGLTPESVRQLQHDEQIIDSIPFQKTPANTKVRLIYMNNHFPINTELGILKGRDCIFLDEVKLEIGQNNLILLGEINGDLCSREQSGLYIPYEISFNGVLALKMIELDSWDYNSKSSFDEIMESNWIKELGGKVKSKHRHFFFQTYDEVFEIVCSDYVFTTFKHLKS